jgi:cardiolipin synthase
LVLQRIPRRYRTANERFVAGNRIRLLRDGRDAFPAMLGAIKHAHEQILLDMYWFDSDRIGRRFATALLEARARGVEVRVIYDSLGSITADTAMFDELRAAGIHVLEFNPIAPWKRRFHLSRLTRRDHRKILVVDGVIGFTGGINIADPWLPMEDEGLGWRDDCVLIEGPAVQGLMECFFDTWSQFQLPDVRRVGWAQHSSPEIITRRPRPGEQQVRILGERTLRKRHEVARNYVYQIYRAERRVWISNSYFVPDGAVLRALMHAARRGVDVRVIVPGEIDVEIVRYASRAVWSRLMRNGVQIFEWHKNVLHSKTAVIDGRWSTVGTFNLDYLSIRLNLEVNAAVLDEGFGATMEASFQRDLEDCREVDLHNFRFRSLGDRLLERIFYRFRKLL